MTNQALIERARWRRAQIAETFASVRVSAPCYGLAKDVFFVPIVEPELKLIQIQGQILLADIVIGANDSALQQRPKAFDALRVDIPAHVLTSGMPDELMLAVVNADCVVPAPFIRDNQRRVSLGNFANESSQGFGVGTLNYLADQVTLARDCADHSYLAGSRAATALILLAVLPMAIDVFPADERFINFDDPHQLPELRVFHSSAQPHAHVPRGLIRAGSEHAMDLERADSLLRRDHQVQNLKPHEQRLLGFLEDGSCGEREPIGRAIVLAALFALPVPRARFALVHMIVLATSAADAIRPAATEQIRTTCFLIRKQRIELAERHLYREVRLMGIAFIRHDWEISKITHGSQEPDTPPKNVSRKTFVSGS